MLTKEEVVTPDCKTIADVCAYLKLPVDHSVKAVAYNSEKGLILVLYVAITKSMKSKLSIPAALLTWKWRQRNN